MTIGCHFHDYPYAEAERQSREHNEKLKTQDKWWVWRNGVRDGAEHLIALRHYFVYLGSYDHLPQGEPVFVGSEAEIKAWAPNAHIVFRRVSP